MLESSTITGFRGLKRLRLHGLQRVNLIVGRNNCGKTSVLEALEILAGAGRPAVLLRGPRRRREIGAEQTDERRREELDLRHLFHGHELAPGVRFSVEGMTRGQRSDVVCEVVAAPPRDDDQPSLFTEPGDGLDSAGRLEANLGLRITSADYPAGVVLPFNRMSAAEVGRAFVPTKGSPPVQFLPTEGIEPQVLRQMWDGIVLTEEESRVVEVLQILDTNIERIAFTGRDAGRGVAVLLKLRDGQARTPLGSVGDGVRRLFNIAVMLARSAGGVLLIDEIDTGLHYSALESLWRVVTGAAQRLDVQVFATTHSGDCVRALAYLSEHEPNIAREAALFRLEEGASDAVRYAADELAIAARHHIEVRG